MKASLIIAIYNNIRFLKAVLDSLQLQTEKDFEIIIAEDGETPAVKEFIDAYNFKQSWQHLTQKDEGWRKNQALNLAIRAAKAEWLIFIDGDCIPHPRFIEMHLRYAGEQNILAGKRVKLDKSTSVKLLNESLQIFELQKRMFRKLIFGKGTIKFIEEGFEACLDRRPTSRIYERKTDGDLEAKLVSLCCSEPPKGYAKWSLRLLADKMVELNYVESISHVTVSTVLKKTNLNLGK